MKAKDLIKELKKYPEFEVSILLSSQPYAGARFSYDRYVVNGAGDVGPSSKEFVLDVEYKED